MSGFPADLDCDGIPTAELDIDETDRIEIPPDRRVSGEHPAWTAGIARATRQLQERLSDE